jgi:hypothetical protein
MEEGLLRVFEDDRVLGLVAGGLEVQVVSEDVLFARGVGEGDFDLELAPTVFFDLERRFAEC